MGKQKPTFARQTFRTAQDLPKIPSGVAGPVTTRRLRVIEYRGSGFTSNGHPYIIEEGIQIKRRPGVMTGSSAKSRPSGAGRTTRTVSQE